MSYNLTIMKQNPLILAEFQKTLSEVDHDVVNVLLHALQNKIKIEEENINLLTCNGIFDRIVKIPAKAFKQFGAFGINANEQIFQSLKKIRDTSATVRNFTDVDGRRIKAMTVSLIDGVKLIDEEEKNGVISAIKEHYFEVQINNWFLQTSTKEFNTKVGNYTPISLFEDVSLSGAFAKKMYEILRANQFKETTFSFKLEEMQKIFSLHGRALSYFVNNIKRDKEKLDRLIKFEYEVFKSDKIISFRIV